MGLRPIHLDRQKYHSEKPLLSIWIITLVLVFVYPGLTVLQLAPCSYGAPQVVGFRSAAPLPGPGELSIAHSYRVQGQGIAECYRLEPRLLKSPEYRLRDWSFLTAMPKAFFCPITTSNCLARVIPV